MTTPIYPAHLLPCFLHDGHSYAQANTIHRTEFQSGRTRKRRLFKDVPEAFTVSTIMTDTQLETFEAWLHWKVKDVGQFDIEIHSARGYTTRRVSLAKNDFKKQWKGSGIGWKIALTLETEGQNYLTESELDARL